MATDSLPPMTPSRLTDVARITTALIEAGAELKRLWERNLLLGFKTGDDPVTEADLVVDALLKRILPQDGDGWLSEETVDDPSARMGRRRCWIVDPLDGTREYVEKIPEWCVSIGLVEDGVPIAGGIHNPITKQLVVGAVGHGVTLNGRPVVTRPCKSVAGAEVLASNSEVARGEWDEFADGPIQVVSVGSVAYKIGLVAAGLTAVTAAIIVGQDSVVRIGVLVTASNSGDITHDGTTFFHNTFAFNRCGLWNGQVDQLRTLPPSSRGLSN